MRSFVLVAILTGCAGSPVAINSASPEALQSEDSSNLCNAYANGHSSAVKAELNRRFHIAPSDWPDIDAKLLRVGMSELAFICSWGLPGLYGTINQTGTASGISKQYVYRACNGCKASYVYIRRNVVSSWQQ